MMELLYVGLGGALGAMLRYLIGRLPVSGPFPVKTLLINLLGSLAIGWLSARLGRNPWFNGDQLFFITGLCGGFTTFSTLSLDTLTLLQNGHYGLALTYSGASLGLGLSCVAVGFWLGTR